MSWINREFWQYAVDCVGICRRGVSRLCDDQRTDNGPIAARAQAFIDEQRAIDQRECAARHGSAGVAYQACMQAKSIDRRVMLEEMLEQLEGRRTALAKQCHDPVTAAPAVCYDT